MPAALRNRVAGLDIYVDSRAGLHPYINLDNTASTPPFKSVLQVVQDFAPWYASVHRGNGLKSRLSTEIYEQARHIVGSFVGADPSEHVVIFGKNTTEAINKLSYRLNLKKKDVVLISHLEHHSNDLPWRARATVKRIGLAPGGEISKTDFTALLNRYAGQVKLVAISGASNVTGHMPDIYWFARQAHQAGAQIFIDCAQLAAHRPINMGKLNDPQHLDYIALSGHKMYAPFGTGALIGRRDTFMRGEPEYRGGGTVSLVTTKTVDWALPPDSEEAGSPNVIGAVAMARAAQTITDIGLDAIARHETTLTSYLLKQFKEIPELVTYGSAETTNRSGVVPFNITGVPAHLTSAILGFEWGIGVRSGCFCAQPYVMSLLGVDRAQAGRIRYHALHKRRDLLPGMVRVSIGLYNTQKEIARGQHGSYEVDETTGFYTPVNLNQNLLSFFNI